MQLWAFILLKIYNCIDFLIVIRKSEVGESSPTTPQLTTVCDLPQLCLNASRDSREGW